MHGLINVSQKFDKTAIDDAEDLNLVLPVYNMVEYSSNYLKQQEVYGFIEKTKQLILRQILLIIIILNLSSISLKY